MLVIVLLLLAKELLCSSSYYVMEELTVFTNVRLVKLRYLICLLNLSGTHAKLLFDKQFSFTGYFVSVGDGRFLSRRSYSVSIKHMYT